MKLNVQRTLAIELQRLSVQFRKQQKAYLNRLRQKNGPSASGASFSVLDETAGTSGREALDPEYDPGFNEIQVRRHNKLLACLPRWSQFAITDGLTLLIHSHLQLGA